jgi:hypothetical protein
VDWFSKLYYNITQLGKQTQENVVEEESRSTGKCPFGFGSQVSAEPVSESVTEITATTATYPEFDKAYEKFDVKRDIMVMPEGYDADFDEIYQEKLRSLEGKLIYIKASSVNKHVAVVTAGGYGTHYGFY